MDELGGGLGREAGEIDGEVADRKSGVALVAKTNNENSGHMFEKEEPRNGRARSHSGKEVQQDILGSKLISTNSFGNFLNNLVPQRLGVHIGDCESKQPLNQRSFRITRLFKICKNPRFLTASSTSKHFGFPAQLSLR